MRIECTTDFVRLNGKTYTCPISAAMDLVGGKWKPVIIYHLKDKPKRFSELRRDLVSATDATLSIQLKQLESSGLVSRQIFGDKPPLKSIYSLTDFGRTFLPALQELTRWGNQIITERGQFTRKSVNSANNSN
ncbi:helix-turn-helix domain-containing protein [Actinomyces viscosus]|uniref:winged helix-turn-helix transcriptional regulator n=1 Tax=Actinomyces viscosus TaxID=1656 RepID=UPI0028F106BE|nr:helix-turn-helix domain-containing protein [Actinomyces viscosus]